MWLSCKPFRVRFTPFPSLQWSLASANITVVFERWFFYFFHFFYIYYLKSSIRKICPFLSPYLFNHLFTSVDSWIFYFLGFNLVLQLFILLFNLFQLWSVLLGWLLSPFDMSLTFFFFPSITFWHYMMLQVHLMFSLFCLWICNFFREPWPIPIGMVFRKWGPGATATWASLLPGPLSR